MLQESEAAQSQASIEDYGRAGEYQIIQPAYPAPKFLQSFNDLKAALRECSTLCRLEGKPFRVVRWGRSGAGARGGIPCGPCRRNSSTSRFPLMPAGPRKTSALSGCLHGYPDATPIAEIQPSGRRIVYDENGNPRVVGRPNYVVSANPFPRMFTSRKPNQTYTSAVKTAEYLASQGQKTYICTSPGVPVGCVDPGTSTVQSINKQQFRELLAQSKGASFQAKGT